MARKAPASRAWSIAPEPHCMLSIDAASQETQAKPPVQQAVDRPVSLALQASVAGPAAASTVILAAERPDHRIVGIVQHGRDHRDDHRFAVGQAAIEPRRWP